MLEINPELLRAARDEVTRPRHRKQAALDKEALVPADPSQGMAPDPSQQGPPPGAPPGAPPGPPPGPPGPGAGPAPAADPSQAGAPPASPMDPMAPMRQVIREELAQMGAGGGGGGKGGKGKHDLLPEIHSQLYRLNAVVTALANASGLQIPPEAVQGPPPDQAPQTPQPNPQPQMQGTPPQQAGIPPIEPMDGQLPKAAAALALDEEDEDPRPLPVDIDKYGSLLDIFNDEAPEPAVQSSGTVFDALSMSSLRDRPALLAARLRERNRAAR